MIELLLEAERARLAGELDRAERMFRQAEAADPRSAIAVVGLAEVALDRGDAGPAAVLARRALTIDPEDGAALRILARLATLAAAPGATAAGPVTAPASRSWLRRLVDRVLRRRQPLS